ncbi:MAG: PspC domain-containing protein [archaeon]
MSKNGLYRSKQDKIIAGVCGGIAEHFDVNPTALRLIWIFLCVVSFLIFVLIYLILWAVLKENPKQKTPKLHGSDK